MHRSLSIILFFLICLVVIKSLSASHPFAPPSATFLPLLPSTARQVDSNSCPAGNRIAGTEFCTHGADATPFGYTVEQEVQPLANAYLDPAPVICDGDGVSGQRIQVLYVRTTETKDRYAKYLPSIRAWVAEMDGIFASGAQDTGGVRHLRFVTDAACQVDVVAVEIPNGKEETFGALINALDQLGYNRRDRKYLLFVDAKVLCGTGTILYDSQPGPENINNTKSGYARIDSGCWGAKPLVHELIHTLGGVQHDAPHSTQGWHCIDEYDIMCYSDAPYHPKVDFLCTDTSHETRLDCNHDDYFHTDPPPDSYLATHWNVANSGFLIPTDGPSPPPEVTLIAPTAAMTFTTPITLALTAHAVDRDGSVQQVEFFENNTLLTTVLAPTYSYTWTNAPTGVHTLYAKAYDNVGTGATSAPLTIVVTDAGGLINSARGKTASQASTTGNQAAARAVDGITQPDAADSSIAQTQVQFQPWWQVDLAAEAPLTEVRIWGDRTCCGEGAAGLEVLIAPTPIITDSLASAVVQPNVDHYHLASNGENPLILQLMPGQKGRYVLIGAVNTTALTLTEVEVMVRPEDAAVGGQEGPRTEEGIRLYFPLVSFNR